MIEQRAEDFRITNTISAIWSIFRQDKIALFSLFCLSALVAIAILVPYLSPYSPDQQFIGKELIPPFWDKAGDLIFLLGTDDIGRDLFSRLLWGVHYTFGSALLIVLAILLLGGVLGLLVGINQGVKSRTLKYLGDIFLSIPILLVAIIIAALMDSGLQNAMLAIFLALLPHFIHQIDSAVQQELQKDYVVLLRLEGISKYLLLKETIVPNIFPVFVREISRIFILAIMDVSALSFISLGAASTVPEWGAMIRDALDLLYIAPWAVVLPGTAIMLSILVIIILSNSLLRAFHKYHS
ncbi:peptide ABC transporter permease [Gallibacterium salpingitidis]|uniref:Peptide ABC transporter permease n=1 Tax=Gallibacterium salpingitidis TaxID=505341 RepID=A0A1A7Q7D4_9PAST|nr:ABC transporter permease subunit [Gallibacterium salpingitidis]OBW94436.1 peptide ABC transporter permease [Gallibacterium salpingitidis]OBX10104.1 peptide ABC transporter permease [Gallibacterium salpingitidis]OBX11562.1 peptide ABC transporter permease [Gallibacterium salpingitidis]WKS98662.1 ABC transporter permease subunit [Gallibacterium salpingitidis]